MIQSRGFNVLEVLNSAEVVYKIANKANDLSNKVALVGIIKIADISGKFLLYPENILPDPIKFGMERTLTKRNYYKNYSSRRRISHFFFRPLMTAVRTPLATSVLIPLRLTAAASVTDAAIQNFWIKHNSINNFK